MEKRKVSLEFDMPMLRVDWLAKVLFNVCDEGDISKMEVSLKDSSVIVSLTSQHVEAIANEAVTYYELEQKVIEIVSKNSY